MDLSKLVVSRKNITLKMFGSSMEPLLLDKDIVYLKRIHYTQIGVNDLITVRKSQNIFTHRVIYKNKHYLITKGDHNTINDGKIYPKQIVGRVQHVKRNEQIINPYNIYLIQSTLYLEEIMKIVKEFDKYGMDYVFLKGLPLHLYYEGQSPSRIYNDCDILIDRNKLNLVKRFFSRNGYNQNTKIRFDKYKSFIESDLKEINYYKIVSGVKVIFEIHLEITFLTHEVKLPFPKLQKLVKEFSSNLLSQKRIISIHGNKLPILEEKNLIIYLLLHFFTHNFTAISRLELILNIIKSSKHHKGGNWIEILNISNKYQLINFVLPGIYLLNKYYGVDKPYKIAAKFYERKLEYSLFIYRLLCSPKYLFDKYESSYKAKIIRAFLIFFYYDDNLLYKIYSILKPRIILHFFYTLISARK